MRVFLRYSYTIRFSLGIRFSCTTLFESTKVGTLSPSWNDENANGIGTPWMIQMLSWVQQQVGMHHTAFTLGISWITHAYSSALRQFYLLQIVGRITWRSDCRLLFFRHCYFNLTITILTLFCLAFASYAPDLNFGSFTNPFRQSCSSVMALCPFPFTIGCCILLSLDHVLKVMITWCTHSKLPNPAFLAHPGARIAKQNPRQRSRMVRARNTIH